MNDLGALAANLSAARSASFDLPPILMQYWQALVRRKWTVLLILGAALALGLIATLLMAPNYTARVQLQIDRQQKQVVTKVEGLDAPPTSQDLEFYATQYSLLKARPLAERVASQLNLYNSDAFFRAHGLDRAAYLSGTDEGEDGPGGTEDLRREVITLLLDNVEIVPIRASRLVDVTYSSRDPALSAMIANTWASSFISSSMDRQFASTADARKFLESRLQNLREKVEESERQAVQYGSRSGIVALDQVRDLGGRTVGNRTLAGVTLEQLSAALNQATAERIAAQSRAGGTGETTEEAITSTALAGLRQKRAEVAASLAKLQVQFEDGYPAVRELAQQRRALDAAIALETGRIASSRAQEYREALQKEKTLEAKVAGLKAALASQNQSTIQYNIYLRESETNRQLYDALLQRYKEIGVAGAVGVNNIAVVEPAIVPDKPSSPRLGVNLAVAMLAGIALALGTVFVLEQLDEGIRETGQVPQLLQAPVLGMTPALEGADVAEATSDPTSPIFDAYFSIKTTLGFATSHGLPVSLAVTSTKSGEGKSSSALALAQVIGRSGKQVLLIDADLRSPSIHHMIGSANTIGLANLLAGEDDWQGIVHESPYRNVSVITAGPVPPSAAELLGSERLAQLIDQTRGHFDHVIIDSPPVLGMADGPLIAKAVEGAVFVVQAGSTHTRSAKAALQRLAAVNCRLFGVILTKVPRQPGQSDYGYGYGYGYGRSEAPRQSRVVR